VGDKNIFEHIGNEETHDENVEMQYPTAESE
jgi:hypothetical protein